MNRPVQKLSERPLSPFMHYRKGYTMTLSILHRITGVALSIGSIVLVYWLVAAASGRSAYAQATGLLGIVVVKIALAGWIFSFCYHLLNGIRHLVWDSGYGFEKKVARRSGYTVAIGSIVLASILVFLFFFFGKGGAQ
jgi:succinate dehydrogenase / fumarate reductase cytochrome b subunit